MGKSIWGFLFILTSFQFLIINDAFTQSRERLSYQAVVRDTSSNLVVNRNVGMRVSIISGSVNGLTVYSEIQVPSTNENGLITIEIGNEPGFDTITWSNGLYFLKTEIDIDGGLNYSIISTSQLLSVPYALHSKTADNINVEVSTTGDTLHMGLNNWVIIPGLSAANVIVPDTGCVAYQLEKICFVDIDTNTWRNRIIWNKTPNVGTAGFNIYKEVQTNIYSGIGYVPFNSSSYFIDITSNPEIKSERYKITSVAICGEESNKSTYHQTINLQISQGVPSTTINLTWTPYVDESGEFMPEYYYIYRGINAFQMQLVDSVSGNINTYNDVNVFDNYYYIIEIEIPDGCGGSKNSKSKKYTISSNIVKSEEY